jgi:hypothetical protein
MNRLTKFLLSGMALVSLGAIAYAQSVPGVGSNFPVGWNMVWESTTPKATFTAAFSLQSQASATDVVEFVGSATKTIRVRRVRVNGIAATTVNALVILSKRTALNDGSLVPALNMPSNFITPSVLDTGSQTGITSATATVERWAINPTEPAASTMTILAERYVAWGNPTTGQSQLFDIAFAEGGSGVPVLRGAAQALTVNLAGVTYAGGQINVVVEWTEE